MPININITKVSKSFIHKDGTVTEGGIEENMGHNMGRTGLPNQVQSGSQAAPEETKE